MATTSSSAVESSTSLTAYYLSLHTSLPEGCTVTLVEGTGMAAGQSRYAGEFLARGKEWHTLETASQSVPPLSAGMS